MTQTWKEADEACKQATGHSASMIANPTPGCARCRMDLIRFTRKCRLRRFTMEAGDEWKLPQVRYTEGGAMLDDSFVHERHFEIVERDHTRACHNGSQCPGAS